MRTRIQLVSHWMIGAKVHNCAYAHLCPLWSYSFVMENPFRRILFCSTWLEAKYNIIFSPAVFISIPPPSPPPLSLAFLPLSCPFLRRSCHHLGSWHSRLTRCSCFFADRCDIGQTRFFHVQGNEAQVFSVCQIALFASLDEAKRGK